MFKNKWVWKQLCVCVFVWRENREKIESMWETMSHKNQTYNNKKAENRYQILTEVPKIRDTHLKMWNPLLLPE